ncbi:MAG TPA: metallophosphoesterase family protein [Anaerolineaceae bacterium]|jgi:predicted phosphodiesterase
MRTLVISDIHANLPALEAVLQDAGMVDAVWCLGDLIGYGPYPNECIDKVRGLPNLICLLGNHDAAALGQIDVEAFNLEAKLSVVWMKAELTEASLGFLSHLPDRVTTHNVTLTHGSPRNPVWEYILDTRTATTNFRYFSTPYCFIGHTHLPTVYTLSAAHEMANVSMPGTERVLNLDTRTILNPGSVGQPRDHDPRSSYAIYETELESWEYHRVEYDIASVQARILEVGLPARHAQRLAEGW